MRVGSLFAGIGGFDLAARWMGWHTAWVSEIDPWASALLARQWPHAPNLGDITRIDWRRVAPVDLLCGGFPCQDISDAGLKLGIDGPKSSLWREYARAIDVVRPRFVVVENVAALLDRGLERVLGDLASLGYDAEWTVLSAADVGARHLRRRIWIVAYPEGARALRRHRLAAHRGAPGAGGSDRSGGRASPPGHGAPGPDTGRADDDVADAVLQGLEGDVLRAVADAPWWRSDAYPAGPDRWTSEPGVDRVAHGVPGRVDRLRGLGNAIVPACAWIIFRAIARWEVA